MLNIYFDINFATFNEVKERLKLRKD